MLFLKYFWNTKLLWNIVNEIWSATWAFLVWIWPYSIHVMYLFDLVELLLDNTHETKLQAFTKNTVWQFKFCYFYFIVIITITIFFKSKKDKRYYLYYWID